MSPMWRWKSDKSSELGVRSLELGVRSSELVFVIGRKIVKICRWQILGSKN
jgi:hypothetical protein